MHMCEISKNLLLVKNKIRIMKDDCDLPDQYDPTIIAVSKYQPIDKIRSLLDIGHLDFGENIVQESLDRWLSLKEEYPEVRLHFIGHLQSNKVQHVVQLFDVIHSLDRFKIIEAIAKEEVKQQKILEHFLQINIGEEVQKYGFAIDDFEQSYKFIREKLEFDVSGLMSIPPRGEPVARYFALTKKIATDLGIKNISIGMSADYEKAIIFQPKYIRVGTVLFGDR